MDGLICYRQTKKGLDGGVVIQAGRYIDRWREGVMDGWMDGSAYLYFCLYMLSIYLCMYDICGYLHICVYQCMSHLCKSPILYPIYILYS